MAACYYAAADPAKQAQILALWGDYKSVNCP
jgi:hypothetical protein